MANNYLITGYHGEPHVTAENDRGINAGTFGPGRFVLPVGERFRAEYIGNNTIRMYDGKLMDNGAAAGIPAGEYVDFLIANAGQNMKRNDLIVFQYTLDSSTAIESGNFVVIRGTETSGTPSDPGLTQSDLLTNKATFDQMALWRVSVSGATISAPVQVFRTSVTLGAESVVEQGTDGIWTYRKWASGIRECWGTGVHENVTFKNTNDFGLVYTAWNITSDYPTGLFSEKPKLQATVNDVNDGTNSYPCFAYTKRPGSKDATPEMALIKLSAATDTPCTVKMDYYAIGK